MMNIEGITARHRKLLAWLTEIAEIGEAAPMLPAMRRRIGASQDSSALTALRALHDAGLIVMEGDNRSRVITIVATGKSTKRPAVIATDDAPAARPTPPIRRPVAKRDPMDRLLAVSREIRGKSPSLVISDDPVAPHRQPAAEAPAPTPTPEIQHPVMPAPIVAPPPPPPVPSSPSSEEIEMSQPVAADIASAPSFPGLKADVAFSDGALQLTIWLSTDPGPARHFRHFMTVPLDEIGANELLVATAIALRDAHQAVS